jgi:hypothetical protein
MTRVIIINTEGHVVAAIKWLCANYKNWRTVTPNYDINDMLRTTYTKTSIEWDYHLASHHNYKCSGVKFYVIFEFENTDEALLFKMRWA